MLFTSFVELYRKGDGAPLLRCGTVAQDVLCNELFVLGMRVCTSVHACFLRHGCHLRKLFHVSFIPRGEEYNISLRCHGIAMVFMAVLFAVRVKLLR